jgi:1-phosphatidylinositol-3-phosphate 5-kinase
MNFYGSNDIPLGCFLERYCFRSTYNCPSKPCGTPMFKHIRRFVHNAGCVSISLNHFENEFAEENIVMWTWCTKCQGVSPVVPMSADTWSFSFAKYLELKFYGGVYSRRGNTPCGHSLHHDHYQYFGFKNSVASFKYTSIQIWDISLPPPIIYLQHDTERHQAELIDEIRTMAQKGHEIYSLILEKLACMPVEVEGLGNLKQLLLKEQAQFKQKVEEVQLKLTSPTIENKHFEENGGICVAYWKISDALIRIKRLIVETVEVWNLRLSEAARKRDNDKRKDRTSYSDLESPTIPENKTLSETDISHAESASVGVAKKIKSLDQPEGDDSSVSSSPKCHQRSQSDGTVMSHNDDQADARKDTDKKSVKNILSQLLPSSTALTLIPSPFSTQDHYTLPTGVSVPIVVYEGEPSSIVAYSLNSYDYKKSFEEITSKKNAAEQTPSPVVKRKSQSQDKSETNDDKASGLLGFLRNKDSKNDLSSPISSSGSDCGQPGDAAADKTEDAKKSKNLHIEVQFQDAHCNFFCRIYFAEKFASLRAQVLPIGEEGYIRSLSRSVQWNARGGKSGSNFAKTADDRFVLKDMSKSEVQLFLESAPNYFAYMHKCYSTGQPTLLGKIVGIYQVIFKNNSNASLRTNLLVMENLFYNRTVSQKFDLKGSMRNRMVNPDNQEGEIVLLDENLLKMTCDAPLYILPHSKAVLTAAIQNDTEFLSAQSVMDYSLLVGLDSENKELVLGIIDYIRTFTWDKKLETMVKKSGILGGQGKLPTIVSPEEYQKRFIEAMHRYFLEVPDHWAGLGKGLEF